MVEIVMLMFLRCALSSTFPGGGIADLLQSRGNTVRYITMQKICSLISCVGWRGCPIKEGQINECKRSDSDLFGCVRCETAGNVIRIKIFNCYLHSVR